MPATISPIELVWTVAALVGVLVNVAAMLDAWRDLRALHALHLNGAREIVARGNIRRECFRIFKQSCFLVVGLYFMAQPPAPSSAGQDLSVAGLVLVSGLLLASFSMDLGAAIDRHERKRLIAYITAQLAQAGH